MGFDVTFPPSIAAKPFSNMMEGKGEARDLVAPGLAPTLSFGGVCGLPSLHRRARCGPPCSEPVQCLPATSSSSGPKRGGLSPGADGSVAATKDRRANPGDEAPSAPEKVVDTAYMLATSSRCPSLPVLQAPVPSVSALQVEELSVRHALQ